jgi:hypothetical protein
MVANIETNGDQTAEPVRVRYGPRPDDTIPLSWAAEMLQEWRKVSRSGFGKALTHAALGDDG